MDVRGADRKYEMIEGSFDPDVVLKEAEEAGLIELFGNAKAYIDSSLFIKPKGIHGILHTKRVLYHAILLSHYARLDRESRNVLVFCALYYDIGRDADGVDDLHGANSALKIKQYDLWNSYAGRVGLSDRWLYYAIAIIQNHSIADEQGIAAILSDNAIDNKQQDIDLYLLFKDADGLDRVRLMDLDVRYLRSPAAKRLDLFAYRFLQIERTK